MATTTTITKLLFRRGNDADRKQTILASGEPGFTLDTKRLWIGDGVTPGGVPALSAREEHLHYIDQIPGDTRWSVTEKHNTGGAQFLDINVPGLSKTLAGDTGVTPDGQRWFHPVNKTIDTRHGIKFTGNEVEIEHTGSGPFRIGKTSTLVNTNTATGNIINIWDAVYIKPMANGKRFVEISTDDLVFTGSKIKFEGSTSTHFEDKTVDLNVEYSDPAKTIPDEPGALKSSSGAGLYLAHNNFLSAGRIAVDNLGNDNASTSTLVLQPPQYYPNWESRTNGGYISDVTSRVDPDGQDTFTHGWIGTEWRYYSEDYNQFYEINVSKPLKIQSVRPPDTELDFNGNPFTGDPHFVYEAGLIVYDAGDPGTGAYNAYKINQSLDTRAKPQFAGIKIEKSDGTPGDPMDVRSGGTGQNSHSSGSVLYTTGNWDDGETTDQILSLPVEQGCILVGTNTKGLVSSKLETDPIDKGFLNFVYDEGSGPGPRSDGVIKIENHFSPMYLENDTDTRLKWFTRFGRFAADSGVIDPVAEVGDPRENVTFKGDSSASDGGCIRTEALGTTKGSKHIKVYHTERASYLFDKGHSASTLQYTRTGTTDDVGVRTSTIYAGQTSTDDYLGGLLPVNDKDPLNGMPDDIGLHRKGHAFAGVKIDQFGHVIGLRSKDFDERYPRLFKMGTGIKDSVDGYYGMDLSPADLPEQVHIPTFDSVIENNYLSTGEKSSDYNKVTRVMTGLSFGEYGTISDYTHENLHDIFYDKTQVASAVNTLDFRLNTTDANLSTLGDSSYLRNANTFSDRKIRTGWYSGSSIEFGGGNFNFDEAGEITPCNKIYADTSDWHFMPHDKGNMSFYVPPETNHEWRRLDILDGDDFEDESTNASNLMMRLAADANGKTSFDLSYDNLPRFKFQQGDIIYVDQNDDEVMRLSGDQISGSVNPISKSRVWVKSLLAAGDVTIDGADLYIKSSTDFEPEKRSSRIHFYDSNSQIYRDVFWSDYQNEFRVDDNTGTDYALLHTGNATNYLLNTLKFDERFVNTTGDIVDGDLTITSLYKLSVDKINVIGNKGLIVNTGLSDGKTTGQTDSWMYLNSEFGLKITTPSTEGVWANTSVKKIATLNGTQGYFGSNRMFADDYHPNADKLTTARNITLTGDASGVVSFDGSKNVELNVVIADDSHKHVIGDIDGLETLADGKVDLVGDTMTGKLTINVGGEALRIKDTSGSGNPEIRLYQNTTHAASLKYTNTGTVLSLENLRSSSSLRIVNSTANGLTHRHLNGSNSVDATIITTANIGAVGNAIQKNTTTWQTCIGGVTFESGLIIGKTGNSYISFVDANSSSAKRQFGWFNANNDWYGDDNNGTKQRFYHTGNTGTLFTTLDTRYSLIHSHPYLSYSGGTGSGNYTFTGTVTVNTKILCEGDIVAFYSDERLKTNLGSIDDPIGKVKAIDSFFYEANEKAQSLGYTSKKRSVGVSAQSVQKVLPEAVELAPIDTAVTEDGDEVSKTGEEYLTVNYDKLVPLLLESIKVLEQRVAELEARDK